MIVSVKAPAGAVEVRYGLLTFRVADDGTLDVPAYIARTLTGLANFSCTADLSKSAAVLLAAGEDWEANYILQAYGKNSELLIPDEIAAAVHEAATKVQVRSRALTVLNIALQLPPAEEGQPEPVRSAEDEAALASAAQAVEDAQAELDAAMVPYDAAVAAAPKNKFDAAKALIAARGEPMASVL